MSQAVLTIATRNRHKTREIQEILGAEFLVQDLTTVPDVPEVEETGRTFRENAILKAVAVSHRIAGVILADDSGLEVDVLEGEPGVFSARYSGSGDDRQNLQKLLSELKRVDPHAQQRGARFRCVIAVSRNGELVNTFSGAVEGRIIDSPRGSGGFGYDPVFIPTGWNKTFAELPEAEKNRLSHRALAIAAALPLLRSEVTRQ